jgi:hypothetical protein
MIGREFAYLKRRVNEIDGKSMAATTIPCPGGASTNLVDSKEQTHKFDVRQKINQDLSLVRLSYASESDPRMGSHRSSTSVLKTELDFGHGPVSCHLPQ